MKRFAMSLLAMFTIVTGVFAQISEGEPNFSTIPRTGNRPVEGNCGLYLGASVTQIIDMVQNNTKTNVYWALPAINFKYYFTDNWEGRIGFEFSCETENKKISYDDNFAHNSYNNNFTRFLPGVAYHFNTKNILDVYLGAQIPIGFDLSKANTSVLNYSETQKMSTFVIGGGVFMGLQVFVADLPFAIGIEAGYSGYVRTGGHNITTISSEGTTTQYLNGLAITDASAARAHWGADAAITFSYYFHR